MSLSINRFYRLELPVEARGKSICGSSAGWLILLDQTMLTVTLLNPLNGDKRKLLKLPGRGLRVHKHNAILHKAILSSDPSCNPDYKVLAINGDERSLICYQHGNWTMLQALEIVIEGLFSFHKGKVYLVEKDRELFMIIRFLRPKDVSGHETYDCKAYKLYVVEGGRIWTPVDDFGMWTIFLGHNHSAAIRSCEPNCIYFTDDYCLNMEEDSYVVGHDSGVFSLEDGKVEQLKDVSCDVMYVWPFPTCFMPSLSSLY
ncbi:hypothetical protein M0R45_023119 [Rubus argutus]|uniref:KIB1-4 beta-propeller domain-containing protein n=1 Tax=Rubus argutus TaxID=59490 RepID=A0AAW1WQD8_RUBAR